MVVSFMVAVPFSLGVVVVRFDGSVHGVRSAAVSVGARAAMGLAEVRVQAGFPAELLAVGASSLGEAIAGGASRVVIHHGRVVSRTTVTRDYPDVIWEGAS
jgi:hypothetical protein